MRLVSIRTSWRPPRAAPGHEAVGRCIKSSRRFATGVLEREPAKGLFAIASRAAAATGKAACRTSKAYAGQP